MFLLGKGGKKKGGPFPDIEGEESAADFVAKYKRACLGRKTAHRELQEKIASENPVCGKTLYSCLAKICAKVCKSCTFRLSFVAEFYGGSWGDIFSSSFKSNSGKTLASWTRHVANWHFYYRKNLEANISDVRAGKNIYVYIYKYNRCA